MINTPLALYIHWPFCKSKCPYCDFNSHVRANVDVAAWQTALLAELRNMAAWMPQATLSSIFFGGGTPSLMPPALAGALIDEAAHLWPAAPDIEITLEANPTSVETATLEGFRSAGINRVSLGVQSLRAESLQFLGREHSAREALIAVEVAARLFPRYSFDLMYARPAQTAAAWEAELREALGYASGHLSLYQLTIEENTAFHHAYHHQGAFCLPEDDESAALYELTQDIMDEAGLPAYEVSNHARPGEESRHNLAYWRGDAYIGIGPGAHGRPLINGERHASATLKSPERWLSATQTHGHGIETLTPLNSTEIAEERLLMGLRLREGLPLRAVDTVIDPAALTRYQQAGLLEPDAARLRATPNGMLVLNRLISELLL